MIDFVHFRNRIGEEGRRKDFCLRCEDSRERGREEIQIGIVRHNRTTKQYHLSNGCKVKQEGDRQMQHNRRKGRDSTTPTLHRGEQTITQRYVQRDTFQASQKSEEGKETVEDDSLADTGIGA